MMREYIFCSVIESPQMARRSPFFSSKPPGRGALTGLNFAKDRSSGFGSSCVAAKAETAIGTSKKKKGNRFIDLMARVFGFQR